MESKKSSNANELTKVTGGADVEYDVIGEDYEIACPSCFHVFETPKWKSKGPVNIQVDDRYCPTCKCMVSPIVNRLYQ